MASSIESISAQNSVKRSRILYDVTAETTFLPTTDPTILQASIARRKRRIQPKLQQNQAKTSNALTLVTDDSSTMRPITPGTQTNAATSSALALTDEPNSGAGKPQAASGILVVRSMKM